jgi:hypothetical protein
MTKSKKFIYIISKLITYQAPADHREIYVTIINIYIELSNLTYNLVKEKDFLKLFMKYSLDHVFNMFTNADEKLHDDFYISTSK